MFSRIDPVRSKYRVKNGLSTKEKGRIIQINTLNYDDSSPDVTCGNGQRVKGGPDEHFRVISVCLKGPGFPGDWRSCEPQCRCNNTASLLTTVAWSRLGSISETHTHTHTEVR